MNVYKSQIPKDVVVVDEESILKDVVVVDKEQIPEDVGMEDKEFQNVEKCWQKTKFGVHLKAEDVMLWNMTWQHGHIG